MFTMRISLLIAILLFDVGLFSSQNLVENGGFEEFLHCPVGINQKSLSLVKKWKQASKGTSDYFHSCSKKVGVPENTFGSEEAKDGDAYLGLIAFSPFSRNYREYMQTKLSKPMAAGQLYCVEFYVSLADNSQFLIDGLGIYFSKTKVNAKNDRLIPVQPQINNPSKNYLDNANGWTLISDVFEAQGGEQYITIGNFQFDRDINIRKRNILELENINHDYAYYYIDALNVSSVSKKEDCSCTIDLVEKEIADTSNWEIEEYKEVRIETVLFDFDDYTISREEQIRLNAVINLMKDNPYIVLEVVGHTDIIGSSEYNQGLSEKRAQKVMEFLKDRGIGKDRVKINYFGSSKPVATNQTDDGRAQNRRVEFLIIEKAYTDYKQ